jgi:hypothetical protein
MNACMCAVGVLRGHVTRGEYFNNVVHSKSDFCHQLMNTRDLVFTYSREGGYGNEWRQNREIEGTERKEGERRKLIKERMV